MFFASPFLQCQLKSSSPGSPSASPVSPSLIKSELGIVLMFSITNLRQSRWSCKGVWLGWTGLYSTGISIDSTKPVPIPSEIAWISFFYVGFFVLSIPKMYCLSGGASNIFLTILARSVTWIVGTRFLPSPTTGSFYGSCNHAFLKWVLKIASPAP